ncbi:glycosyl transferase [Prochlorococcus marinus str. MIT 9321]|uniref:Glycosyl transferase n=1 Tax=Prochlorococcus marinus str. MIT 9401 TaxID=167551 RepID=A0A0A2BCY7_PROMR|nr:glycosyltransferase family 2 protein [Prochlorococcus marinus]KGG02842.1 glycosyl transferase [Prochlorococcus marinus str. MIT 9321]KGG05465.1 glycosyl transferase [Prochlorococcus marinus str. MIT 9322]KGG10499.1 glycosyl transferase [Prochlorococcus marinus str. MIT 9401]
MVLYSLVIPCFNESKNITLLLERINDYKKLHNFELILVNNGSNDDTKNLLQDISLKYKFLRIVEIKKNIGYGHGIIKGLKSSKGEVIGWTHADMQTDPIDVFKGFEIFRNLKNPQNLFVKGVRKKRKILDNFFSIGMSLIASIFLKTFLWDINAQPNLFHKKFFNKLNSLPNDFSLDLYLLYMARKQKLKIARFPVFFYDRKFGESSWNKGLKSKFIFIKRNFNYILKLSFS